MQENDDPTVSNVASLAAAALKKIAGNDLSEDILARLYVEQHGIDVRFNHTDGLWYFYTDGVWRKNRTRLAFHWSRKLIREHNIKRAPKISAASTAGAVERFAQADPAVAVTGEIFDADPMLLGTPGGTVDLRTGELREARPEDFITRSTAVIPSAPGTAPTLWGQFLGEATGESAELIGYLQRVAGYCLTASVREHALLFVYGSGGNGKSVFLNTLAGILDEYACTAPSDTFTAARGERHPTDLAMFAGARLVVSSETEEGRAWAEARIKSLTGGDPITARFMRRDFFTYRPKFKLIIVGNYRPVLRNIDEAVRRRFQIIPFTRKPERPDRVLEDKLRVEWGAILRWALDGCLEWQRDGLNPPGAVVDATASYFDDQDLLGHWLEDSCQTGPELRATHADLFRSWSKYAETNSDRPGSARSFTDSLRRRGFESVRCVDGKAVRGFKGLTLRAAEIGI